MKEMRSFRHAAVLTLVFSGVAVATMFYDASPVWLGLPVLGILIISAALIGGKYVGAATGFLASAIGLYVKINHFYVPQKFRVIPDHLSPEKLEKLMKQSATFFKTMESYTAQLAQYAIWMILGSVALGFLVGMLFKKETPDEERASRQQAEQSATFRTRTLVYMSVFIALGVIINSVRIGNVSFSGFPIIYSGLALGAVPGFIVGALVDIIGFAVRPGNGAYHVIFTITSALTGMLPALFFMIPGLRGRKKNFIFVFFSILTAQVLTSVIIVPYARLWLFEHPFIVTMTNAAIKQAYSIPIYTFFYLTLDKAIGENFRKSMLRSPVRSR